MEARLERRVHCDPAGIEYLVKSYQQELWFAQMSDWESTRLSRRRAHDERAVRAHTADIWNVGRQEIGRNEDERHDEAVHHRTTAVFAPSFVEIGVEAKFRKPKKSKLQNP